MHGACGVARSPDFQRNMRQDDQRETATSDYPVNPNINTNSYGFNQANCVWNNDVSLQPRLRRRRKVEGRESCAALARTRLCQSQLRNARPPLTSERKRPGPLSKRPLC
ncbi:hypothetical protein SRHO_G00127740 [Serrasalmus rhombeus]